MDPLAFLRSKTQIIQHEEQAIGQHEEQAIGHALVEAIEVDEVEPMPTLIEHNLGSVERVMNKLADQEQLLEQQIAEREERLRQTRITLRAFNAARTILIEENKP